ncbi:MAG: radical SAM protein [Syntrophobacterales bacterium]|jgi:wyosine [tRNA(Phe)-imidazoG37] synthetase (radical SAM superfamily)|nr:radical SAM protein [Syntrophobacterales bacterium]
MSKYVFGPVPSRRLGFSLGVDTIRSKYCSYDCIYCQIGKTTYLEVERRRFFDPDEVVEEVSRNVSKENRVDFVTFSGSGEPTLNSDLRYMIREIKKKTRVPIAIITNGSLLHLEEVRNDLLEADVVLPSLDAASDDIFHYINRPHPLIGLEMVTEGLERFRNAYDGEIWLEIMMIRDINDDPEELKEFKRIIDYLDVDKVHLNTVTRPPCEEATGAMETSALEEVCRFFGDKCEVVSTFEQAVEDGDDDADWEEIVLGILERRSMNLEDIVKITGVPYLKVKSRLSGLERNGIIKSYYFGESIFFLKTGKIEPKTPGGV